jgi:hypothetical protein
MPEDARSSMTFSYQTRGEQHVSSQARGLGGLSWRSEALSGAGSGSINASCALRYVLNQLPSGGCSRLRRPSVRLAGDSRGL